MTELGRSVLELRVNHKFWVNAFQEAFATLTMASPGDVVCIVGPSRAGKSRLIHELKKQLENGNSYESTGKLPVICVEAVNSGPNGAFSTKSFTMRMLEAVRHPLLSISELDAASETARAKLERTTENTLRQILERALKHRGVYYLFIDEAQHVRYASKQSHAPCAVMDSWKCLAQTCGLVLVVVGAYPILELLQHSPHMLGRKKQIHLQRYGTHPDDLVEFAKIIQAFERSLGEFVSSGFLLKHTQLLQEKTCGCIGLLKSWLKQTVTLAVVNKSQISLAMLEKSMMSDVDLIQISREIAEGENLLYSTPFKIGSQVPKKEAHPKIRAGKPFTRKPVRHALGNRSGGGSKS